MAPTNLVSRQALLTTNAQVLSVDSLFPTDFFPQFLGLIFILHSPSVFQDAHLSLLCALMLFSVFFLGTKLSWNKCNLELQSLLYWSPVLLSYSSSYWHLFIVVRTELSVLCMLGKTSSVSKPKFDGCMTIQCPTGHTPAMCLYYSFYDLKITCGFYHTLFHVHFM